MKRGRDSVKRGRDSESSDKRKSGRRGESEISETESEKRDRREWVERESRMRKKGDSER